MTPRYPSGKSRIIRTGLVVSCVLAALVFLALPAAATPIAKFTASPVSGDAPLKVTFTQASTCDDTPCTYKWDFDDGDTSSSTSSKVYHTYDSSGTYTVTLTITNDVNDSDKYTREIEVTGGDPVASFTSDKTSGILPLTVGFEDTSSGDPDAWAWQFGDGNTSTLQNPSHTYYTAGAYKVTLKVTNDDGSDTISKSAYIDVGTTEADPNADFSTDVTSGDAPLKVQFTDESSGYPSKWKWTFGDGSTSTEQNPSHEYDDQGKFTVTLKVTNGEGIDTVEETDYITVGGKPVAAFVASATSGTAPLAVTFTDKSTNDPSGWYWTFGDGTTSSSQNPSHTYTTSGTYTVTLKVTNDIGSNTITKSSLITIAPKTTIPTTVKTTVKTTVPTTRATVATTATTVAPAADSGLDISLPVIGAVALVAIIVVGLFIMRKGRGGRGRWDL